MIECESGFEPIEEIGQSGPDLVFLDVQMPECDGFDVLELLGAAKNYACLHLGHDTHIVRRTMQELGQDLDARTFFRIHRPIIVNLERVRGLEPQERGESEVVLDSKIRLKLSRRFRKRFQCRLDELSSGR